MCGISQIFNSMLTIVYELIGVLAQKSDGESCGARYTKAWELCLFLMQVLQIRFGAC
jgi:hypothetical protein